MLLTRGFGGKEVPSDPDENSCAEAGGMKA